MLGAPHQVILEREHRTSVDSAAMIIHDLTVSRYSKSVMHLSHKTRFPRQLKQTVPSRRRLWTSFRIAAAH